MITKIARNHRVAIAGVTLIELMVTIFISGIAISGLAVAYGDGLSAWRKASEKMVLYNEGSAVLSLMERFVKRASFINTYSNIGEPSDKMDLIDPIIVGNVIFYREAQFYVFSLDNTLRWNNMTGNQNAFNERLLPFSDFRIRPGEKPYLEILEASFTPLDPQIPGQGSSEGCTTVKIQLKLSAPSGDTLTLSSVISKRNTAE